MNEATRTQGGLTTEQIAAGTEQVSAESDRQQSEAQQSEAVPADRSGQAGQTRQRRQTRESAMDAGSQHAAESEGEDEQHAQLLEAEQLQTVIVRWKEIQAQFVDEPRQAVQDADALVADLMQRLATMFARERGELEARWAGGEDVSTEELRQGLRRYRSFFERLLAA
jgi:hypothetical protein